MTRLSTSSLLLASILAAAGCSSSSSDSTADAGASTDAGATDAGTADAGPQSDPCAQPASCLSPAAAVDCVGLVDNTGKTNFSLRVAELAISKPDALSHGILSNVISSGAEANVPSCHLNGNMLLNWLLQFDSTARLLTTGGALPVTDPTQGFSFVDGTVGPLQIQPATAAYTTPTEGSFEAAALDVVIPIYLDAAGTQVFPLPLKAVQISGQLSSGNNCIGHYNSEGLDPDSSCEPDDTHPLYVTDGQIQGFMSLEEADQIIIGPVNSSLCAVLTGNPAMYGEANGMGQTVCKRDGSNAIVFQGDWCSATNAAADGSCHDAVSFKSDFAAQSVTVNE